MDYESLSRLQLIELCKARKIQQYSNKKKQDIVLLLQLSDIASQKVFQKVFQKVSPINIHNEKTLTALDLFCGCGGMSQGLMDAKINVLGAIDIWDKAVNNYNKNFDGHHQALCGDMTKVSPEEFREKLNIKDEIDLITGGPPCQGFSIAGKRDEQDPRNSLFMEYVKYLEYFNPKSFIMENVIGILSMKTKAGDKVIDVILSILEKNYNCIICKLYASDFEVPQMRRRTIIIGFRKDLNIFPKQPEPVSAAPNHFPVGPLLMARDDVEKGLFLSERALQGIENKKRKSADRDAGFGAQYLDLNKPSYTIPARYWKDGYDALVKYNEKEVRRLNITELKRIQSFPDDYILEGSKKDIIIQIGNAVACRFAYHLGNYIKTALQQ